MSKRLHVAIASTTSLPGAVARNLDQIEGFARRAGEAGVALLLTPELSASGYGSYPDVLATAETAGDGPIFERLARIAAETGVVLAAGFVERADERLLLAHYLVYPGGAFLVQRKHRVTEAEQPLAGAVPFVPDRAGLTRQPSELQFECFDVSGVRCAVRICADSGIDRVNEYFAANEVELLLCPTGAGGTRDQRVTTEELYTEEGRRKYLETLETVFSPGRGAIDCIKYRRALAAVNMCGYDGQRYYHAGHGTIINPMGEVEAFFHGIPNLDRQRPMFASAVIDVEDRLDAGVMAWR